MEPTGLTPEIAEAPVVDEANGTVTSHSPNVPWFEVSTPVEREELASREAAEAAGEAPFSIEHAEEPAVETEAEAPFSITHKVVPEPPVHPGGFSITHGGA